MDIPFWYWLTLAAALLLIEIVATGFALIWLGGAAVGTAIIVLLAPALAWQHQLLAFAALSILFLGIWLALARRSGVPEHHDTLNRRTERYVGQIVVVTSPIRDGHGRVAVGDTQWSAVGPDIEAGNRARVTGVDGTRLRVEPVSGGSRG